MANLLSRKPRPDDFPILDPGQLERFASRLRTVAAPDAARVALQHFESDPARFEEMLEELESDGSLVVAFELLDAIERVRRAAASEARAGIDPASPAVSGVGGDLVCYWPGRSLETGEPNLASRGFFDAADRPPLGLWLEAISRRSGSTPAEFELAILAWVPAPDLDRARAGCRACTSGALAWLTDASPDLSRQLAPVVHRTITS